MFNQIKAMLLVGATAILLPAASNAASFTLIRSDLRAGEFFTDVSVISPDEEIEFRFSVLEDLFIDTFALAATGNSTGNDVGVIRFGFSSPGTSPFATIEIDGTSATGSGFLDGGTYLAGSSFSVFFSDGNVQNVGLSLSFLTSDVAPVPLPAGGLLMAPLLIAGAIAGWRRRKVARPLAV